MINSTQALVISIFPLSFLQGVFSVLVGAYLYLVWFPRKHLRTRRSWLGLGTVLLMYAMSTTHFVMVFYQDLTGFGGGPNQTPNPRKFAIFGLAQIALELVNCSLADVLLVWRTWAIWNKDWRVAALPALLVVGSTSKFCHALTSCGLTAAFSAASYVGIGMAYAHLHHIKGDDLQAVFEEAMLPAVRNFQLSGYILSTVTNILLTSLIAYKLLSHHRAMKSTMGFSMLVLETLVIIESGALYSLAWVRRQVLNV
ncbi:hypothetical protein HGRIS_001767 [Hohenbuehelia grisea]|uniref:Uncharacterized protein n=1 Tax=Hohenbuehelia grisea TaxID=104357 RepID=A0ABR3JIE5_9AGAR